MNVQNYICIQVLDCLIWYLRVVHSVDFYNGVSFPSEDCMPHRCGIFTVRPVKPNAVTQDEGTCICNRLTKFVPDTHNSHHGYQLYCIYFFTEYSYAHFEIPYYNIHMFVGLSDDFKVGWKTALLFADLPSLSPFIS